MAARRLVVVMLVLLFVSSLAAALAPVRPDEDEPAEDPITQAPAPPAPRDPELVEKRIDADAEEPPVVAVNVGDQLRVEVISRKPGTVELIGLGPTDDVDRVDPAVFDVLLTEEGTHPLRFLGKKRTLGTIEVTEPPSTASKPPS